MTEQNSKTLSGRIAILGAGAIGLYYGARLRQSGNNVVFQTASGAASIRNHGLSVKLHDGQTFHLQDVPAAADPEEIGPCDWVLVCLKATANSALHRLLPPLLHEDTHIVTLQNGMGNVEALTAAAGRPPLGAGLCFVCVNRVGPAAVENFLPGNVRFAPVPGQSLARLERVAHAFANAGVPTHPGDDLDLALWMKLCWNIPFNGLSIAAGGITTDKIMARPELLGRVQVLMEEVQAAAHAEGKEIPRRHLGQQLEATRRMGAYQPSSLIDFREGRPVEVEALWGIPLRRGKMNGVKMPELEKLYGEVLAACGSQR